MKSKQLIVAIEVASAPLLVGSVAFAHWGFGEAFNKHDGVKVAQAIVLCCWILVPPLWFLFEKWARVDEMADDDKKFERFKYTQDLASKVWLALVSVLLLLYFGKDLSHQESQTPKGHVVTQAEYDECMKHATQPPSKCIPVGAIITDITDTQ